MPTWDAGIQYLVKQGVSVGLVNYRGSSGYGRSFESNNDVEAQAKDVIAARVLMEQKLGLAKGSVILMGSSSGTLVAATALALEPRSFKAAFWVSAVEFPDAICHRDSPTIPLYAFHGRYDASISPMQTLKSLKRCYGDNFGAASTDWRVFPNEGHHFHRSRSWAGS